MPSHAEPGAAVAATPPILVAVLAHIASAVVLLTLGGQAPVHVSGAAWPWAEGVLAALIGAAAGMPWWWAPINLLFVPGAAALRGVEIAPIGFLAAFGALFLTNVTAWRGRVPLFLSSARAARMVLDLLPQRAGFRLIDLGCGTGSLLRHLARARPDGHYAGIELAPLSYLISRWHTRRERAVQAQWGNFWRADLAGYDVVYAYLSPVPMARLWQKARREMRPGSLFVSNGFPVPGIAPTQTLAIDDHVRSTLYVWRM